MIEDIKSAPLKKLKKLLQMIVVKDIIKDQDKYMSDVSERLMKIIKKEVSNLIKDDKDQRQDSFLQVMKSLDEFPSIRSELS